MSDRADRARMVERELRELGTADGIEQRLTRQVHVTLNDQRVATFVAGLSYAKADAVPLVPKPAFLTASRLSTSRRIGHHLRFQLANALGGTRAH